MIGLVLLHRTGIRCNAFGPGHGRHYQLTLEVACWYVAGGPASPAIKYDRSVWHRGGGFCTLKGPSQMAQNRTFTEWSRSINIHSIKSLWRCTAVGMEAKFHVFLFFFLRVFGSEPKTLNQPYLNAVILVMEIKGSIFVLLCSKCTGTHRTWRFLS